MLLRGHGSGPTSVPLTLIPHFSLTCYPYTMSFIAFPSPSAVDPIQRQALPSDILSLFCSLVCSSAHTFFSFYCSSIFEEESVFSGTPLMWVSLSFPLFGSGCVSPAGVSDVRDVSLSGCCVEAHEPACPLWQYLT